MRVISRNIRLDLRDILNERCIIATVMERRNAVSAVCCTIHDLNGEGENGLLLSASHPVTDLSFTPTLLPA
ncbi:hypothetical protein AV530_005571 [Patagioenas fasciata monilis]|uniref:Uncharacterized protein n=1 Tax=Patagioenas fasciata monilis TaxID=372326 RepID=A0A1V4JN59_PATFA|nr:hypothetical protein AV530_005571 [Patagioenas fasciata monilis]